MALYPAAVKQLIPPGPNDPPITPRLAILHVDANNVENLHDYFNGPSKGVESHFHVTKTGKVYQYRDTGWQADANLDANNFAVSIETQGFAAGTWTPAQLDAIKKLLLWLNTTHDIPLRKVNAWDGSGIGYHTMFGSPSHWTPVPKSCPGPSRISQFHTTLVPWMSQARPSLTGGTFNLLVGRDPQTVGAEVRRLCRKHELDFLCVQEATGYRAALCSIPGYRYITVGSWRGSAEVGILVREGVKVRNAINLPVGDGWWRAPKFIARMAPRTFLRVTLNGWLRLGCVHLPAAVKLSDDPAVGDKPKDRADDYLAMMNAVRRFLLVSIRARLVAGDWNQSAANRALHSPHAVARSAGGHVAAPDGGIDYVLHKRCRIDGIHKDRDIPQGSDHTPVIFTARRGA